MSASAATMWQSCKCDLPQIKVTEHCTCTTQQVETPHFCQNYEKEVILYSKKTPRPAPQTGH